ncbi:MAG TPA: monovalent cation/H(+) antiporter subunit G [Tepidisphaeraceae bacterium]|nr:monovalent cation/H(+) antiporter subunit G [Tepidisphaeraceae bacterium]
MIVFVLDIFTVAALLFGLFFMFAGALGVWRLPDFFNRTHAASKCVTLGISGLLLAAVLHFAVRFVGPEQGGLAWEGLIGAATKAVLVTVFLYTAAPVGSHMLARAAHRDGAKKDKGTLGDDLEADRNRPNGPAPESPV